jgi:hypothetical protein
MENELNYSKSILNEIDKQRKDNKRKTKHTRNRQKSQICKLHENTTTQHPKAKVCHWM